ncbi:MAG: hypothetical protein ABR514_08385 [Chthoniobacterales bacterium]
MKSGWDEMVTRIFCAFLFSCASFALATDFKTLDGTRYNGVTVKRVEADGIVIATGVGVSKIYFTELPGEVQERYRAQVSAAAASVAPAAISEGTPIQRIAAEPSSPGVARVAELPPSPTPAQGVLPLHTYELKQDYVIGGDTGAVAKRLAKSQRYRGRDGADGIQLEIDGKTYTVPRDILSAAKD